ncbi:hypothetical protein, partial [Calothrix parietina]|uniref:hypothetical protein n=1 Tax=Calothrix parietina TaxID=32054 RepID=UPI001A7E2426
TAVFTYLNHICRSRGTAPVKLLYVPKDCLCRAPTVWSIYLKIAVIIGRVERSAAIEQNQIQWLV